MFCHLSPFNAVIVIKLLTRNCVYETLCSQPLACPPSFSTGNILTILFQLTKAEATSCKSYRDIFIGSLNFDVQICKGH